MRARSIPEYVYFYDSIRARFFYNIKNITRKSWRRDDGCSRAGVELCRKDSLDCAHLHVSMILCVIFEALPVKRNLSSSRTTLEFMNILCFLIVSLFLQDLF